MNRRPYRVRDLLARMRLPALRLGALALILAAAPGLGPRPAAAAGKPVTIFAAASLKNALGAVIARYEQKSGRKITAVYAASSTLARQIEAGAPAELFISADLDWMNYLDKKGLLEAGTRRNLLGNSLVLVAPKSAHPKPVDLKKGFDLARLLAGGRLAMADTKAVPAGRYGKAALTSLGIWDSVKDHLAEAVNVRAALVLVARAEAPYGIVYRTDAAIEPDVVVVGTFPAASHKPIIYPAAAIKGAGAPAKAFLAYLFSAQAKPLFEQGGFTVLY